MAAPPDEEILKVIFAKVRSAISRSKTMGEADAKLQKVLNTLRNDEKRAVDIHWERMHEVIESSRTSLLRDIDSKMQQRVLLVRRMLEEVPRGRRAEKLEEFLKTAFIPPEEEEMIRNRIIGRKLEEKISPLQRPMSEEEERLVWLAKHYEDKLREAAKYSEGGYERRMMLEQKERAAMILARISAGIFGGEELGLGAARNMAEFLFKLNPQSKKRMEEMRPEEALRNFIIFRLTNYGKPVRIGDRFVTFKKLQVEEPDAFKKVVEELALGRRSAEVVRDRKPETWGPAYLRKVMGVPKKEKGKGRRL